jgi:hypothetical protein
MRSSGSMRKSSNRTLQSHLRLRDFRHLKRIQQVSICPSASAFYSPWRSPLNQSKLKHSARTENRPSRPNGCRNDERGLHPAHARNAARSNATWHRDRASPVLGGSVLPDDADQCSTETHAVAHRRVAWSRLQEGVTLLRLPYPIIGLLAVQVRWNRKLAYTNGESGKSAQGRCLSGDLRLCATASGS